jgi:hypothetical protein
MSLLLACVVLLGACSAPTARDHFEAHPPRGPLPAGWPSTFESGRWATSDGKRWVLWDPATGFVREVAFSGVPTPDGAWLVAPRQAPVRLDPDVKVGVRWEDVGPHRVLWSDAHAVTTGDAQDTDPRCVGKIWRHPERVACNRKLGLDGRSRLQVREGGAMLAEWDTVASSASWSANGEVLVWSDRRGLTVWHTDGQTWSIEPWAGRGAVTSDGSLVLAWDGRSLAIYDAADGTRLDPQAPAAAPMAEPDPVGAITAEPDEPALATSSDLAEWILQEVGTPIGPASCGEDEPELLPRREGDDWVVLADETVPVDISWSGRVQVGIGGGRLGLVGPQDLLLVDPITGEQHRGKEVPPDLWLATGWWVGAARDPVRALAGSEDGAHLAALTRHGHLFLIDRARPEVLDAGWLPGAQSLHYDGEVLWSWGEQGFLARVTPEGSVRWEPGRAMSLRVDDAGTVFGGWDAHGWFQLDLQGAAWPAAPPAPSPSPLRLHAETYALLVGPLGTEQVDCVLPAAEDDDVAVSPSGRWLAGSDHQGLWRADPSACAMIDRPAALEWPHLPMQPWRDDRRVILGEESVASPSGTFGVTWDRGDPTVTVWPGGWPVRTGRSVAVTDEGRVYVVRDGRLYAADRSGERVHPELDDLEAVVVLPTGELAVAGLGRVRLVEAW